MAYKVCLDAGHYGKYNRSPVYADYYESDMTWKLHNYLATELQSYSITVIKTRTSQAVDRELVSRGLAAKGCDLFISLHSNAASSTAANYAIAIHLADKAGVTYDDKAKEIAKKLAATVGNVMGCEGRTGTRAADWDRDGNGKYDDEYYGVLQGAKLVGVPGVIMEHGFHTNLAQAKWLYQDANLKKLAKAQAKTIAEWLGATKKKETPQTPTTPTVTDAYPAVPFTVQVLVTDLNIRASASTNAKSNGHTGKGSFTITKTNGDWGYLKSGAGWIYLANPAYVKIGKHIETIVQPKNKDESLKGQYVVTASALNLRKSPETGEVIVAMPKNTVVSNYGYYTTLNGTKWLYVQATIKNQRYTGFCSQNYLKKK